MLNFDPHPCQIVYCKFCAQYHANCSHFKHVFDVISNWCNIIHKMKQIQIQNGQFAANYNFWPKACKERTGQILWDID